MPLVRVEVRNEFSLGAPELYREANKEDPKDILQGVAVAGLVGVLRQLGDLAEFAAEVFHGLQEEVTVTSSRSRKLMGRVQRIEAALSPVEKAVLAQRSHLHFAYTPGTNWHTRIRCEQNHFVYSDVPQFIMDSYEDSRAPPNLHLLDRFHPGGSGSCLKRYSDPTFFKSASAASGEAITEKTSTTKKARRIKKRRSWPRNGEVSRGKSFSYHSGRMQFTKLNVGGQTSPTQTMSTYDSTLRSDMDEQLNVDLRNGSGYIEGDFRPSYSTQPEGQESSVSISSPVKKRDSDFLDYNFLQEEVTNGSDDIHINQPQEQAGCSSSSVTWDGYSEKLEPTFQFYDHDAMSQENGHEANVESFSPKWDIRSMGNNTNNFVTDGKMDIQPSDQAVCDGIHLEDVDSETDNFMDALNTIESEPETDTECNAKQEVVHCPELEEKAVDDGPGEVIRHNSECQSSNSEFNVLANNSLTGHSPISATLEEKAVDDGPGEVMRQNLESQSLNSEFNDLANSSLIDVSYGNNSILATPEFPSAAYCSATGEAATKELNSVILVDNAFLSAQRSRESMNLSSPQSVGSHQNDNIDDVTNVESVSYTVSSNFRDNISVKPVIDATRSSLESEKPAPETANVAPVTFWTNGSLLGLQPSKPPDWNGSNALSQDSLSNNDGKASSSFNNYGLSDRDAGDPDHKENVEKVAEGPEDHESGYSFRKTSWKISPADLDVKLGKPGASLYQGNAGATRASEKLSERFLPVNSDYQAARVNEDNSRSSSRMFELGNTLLTTGSNKNKKLLPGIDQISTLAGNHKTNVIEQKGFQNVAYQTISGRTKDLHGVNSFMLSPSDSPPLEHMKISFQPIDGFETSKLNLKFPDGNSNNENSREIFPSFQLVPGVSVTLHNAGSDSDDDTFYRSSPSLSDDCHNHHSESNSEQWESDGSPSNKDHDVYDSFRRISLTDSVAKGLENRSAMNGDTPCNNGLQFPFLENSVQNSQSSRSYDLRGLDTLNHSFRELRNDINLKDLEDPQSACNPAPPPLPPVQWRGMKPHMNFMEDARETTPEWFKYAVDVKHSESTVSQQPKPAPLNQDQIFEITTVQKIMKSSSLKTNGQKETNQANRTDEKDFLQQIRTKSFNLKPIAASKTTVPSGGSANIQVTAILEKANAIRQAVGSDGEDDSNWSDT